MNSLTENYYKIEEKILSPYAFKSGKTRGRDVAVKPCPMRTEFQRDRDKITHSKAFRRLMHKTQVFLSPEEDHYRTRLSHTLEVTQIARTIARALRLNEDLTEAMALGHDLGHTPFGHAGEKVLQECFDKDFTHYKQSLRVVERLENNGRGLNLTYEVRDGIVNHTGDLLATTLEGIVLKYADRIAYINHDIDDAMRACILKDSDIPEKLKKILGDTYSGRVNSMVKAVVEASAGKEKIDMESDIYRAMMDMRSFLFERVYTSKIAKKGEETAKNLLKTLFEYYCLHSNELPEEYKIGIEEEGVKRKVCDYIAGMTDRYAISVYKKLFIPEMWRA